MRAFARYWPRLGSARSSDHCRRALVVTEKTDGGRPQPSCANHPPTGWVGLNGSRCGFGAAATKRAPPPRSDANWRGRSTEAADGSEIPAIWLRHAVIGHVATSPATGFWPRAAKRNYEAWKRGDLEWLLDRITPRAMSFERRSFSPRYGGGLPGALGGPPHRDRAHRADRRRSGTRAAPVPWAGPGRDRGDADVREPAHDRERDGEPEYWLPRLALGTRGRRTAGVTAYRTPVGSA